MQQQDTKSLALDGEHPEEAETNDGTKFEKSLQVSIKIFYAPHVLVIFFASSE